MIRLCCRWICWSSSVSTLRPAVATRAVLAEGSWIVDLVCPRSGGMATELPDCCWASRPRALRRCTAASSVVGAGLLGYVCRRASGSSSLSSAGEGAELVVPLPSSSSPCGYKVTEIYDFPSVFRSPKSRSSCAPGGSNDGDAAAARPGSALEIEDGGFPRDLSVFFKFFGSFVYCYVCNLIWKLSQKKDMDEEKNQSDWMEGCLCKLKLQS